MRRIHSVEDIAALKKILQDIPFMRNRAEPINGASIPFTIYLDRDDNINGLYKLNTTTGVFDKIEAEISHTDDKTVITYYITDNGPYDDNSLNTVIFDPFTPTTTSYNVAWLPCGWKLLLLAFLAGAGMLGMRGRLGRKLHA